MLDTFKKATPDALAAIQEALAKYRAREFFLCFGNGSQYDHLDIQMGAKCGVYMIPADPASVTVADVRELSDIGLIGMIGTGGPASVHAEPPPFDADIFNCDIPYFGICLAGQQIVHHIGGKVEKGRSQFGQHQLLHYGSPLFAGLPSPMKVLQSHGDEITDPGPATVWGRCDGVISALSYKHLHAVQFHPECTETTYGRQIFENFFFTICGAKDRFPAEDVLAMKVQELRMVRARGIRVLLLLSGGCDSSILAMLFKAAGFDRTNLRAIYIKGVDRADDEANVLKHFGNQPWIEVKFIDATDRLLASLAGKTKMADKRATGFIPIYNDIGGEEAEEWSEGGKYIVLIGQGTIYTDLVESGLGYETGSRKAQIKLHHNTKNEFRSPRTGELFLEIRPLIDQVKDTARSIGQSLGMNEEVLFRQPFPGPGKVVRIDGEVTKEKLATVRAVDDIWIEELRKADLYKSVWQAGASLLMPGTTDNPDVIDPAKRIYHEELAKAGLSEAVPYAWVSLLSAVHTFSKGDDRGSGPILVLSCDIDDPHNALPWEFLDGLQRRLCNEVSGIGAVAYRLSTGGNLDTEPMAMLWAVYSTNGFTAQHAVLPWEFLTEARCRIRTDVDSIGAVLYRISDKPISTIEIG